jgi:hypothetical protein
METLQVQIPRLFSQFEQQGDGEALKKAVQLLKFASPRSGATKSEIVAHSALRLRLLLTAFNYIDAKLIPDFDFSEGPSLTVAPPFEWGIMAGAAPESIKDPKIRAEYEQLLATNRARTRQYNLQTDLRDADRICTEIFKEQIHMHFERYSEVALAHLIGETVRSKSRVEDLLKVLRSPHLR